MCHAVLAPPLASMPAIPGRLLPPRVSFILPWLPCDMSVLAVGLVMCSNESHPGYEGLPKLFALLA